MYIHNILCIVNILTCFNVSASPSGSPNYALCWSYNIINIIKITTQ